MRIYLAPLLILVSKVAFGSVLEGNEACPCVVDNGNPNQQYGFGCRPHDIETAICKENNCASIIPLPDDCDRSWCVREWCYVDPSNCNLLSTPVTTNSTSSVANLHYSYATCGAMDSFTYTERLRSLKGKTLKVGFNSNSGGWKGAYHVDGSFAISKNLWKGPAVDFVRQAALEGGFTMNITQPPKWLYPQSQQFFGNSSFDFCVYSTALGYLDLCVAAYTINEKRSSVTTFFETAADPIYLVVFSEENSQTSWDTFQTAALTIFAPFTASAWLMIFLFCLPVLGMLMLFHEYGSPGSAFAAKEPTLVVDIDEQSKKQCKVVTQPVPCTQHIVTSLYMSMLSFFQGSYDHAVVSTGGKINLMAISAFVMLVLAVYTANLAAILTQDIQKSSIESLDMAVKAGYNFCSSRKVAELIMNLHRVDPDRFVPDPVHLGGDGKPGFNCPDCDSRTRVFEFMSNAQPENVDHMMHCNAAIASEEDLQVLHKYGQHCDKTRIGDSLGYRTIGIPIYDGYSEELVSLFHRIKTEGVMNQVLSAALPESQCPSTEGEGTALTVQQLTGIWVITFSFAIVGIIAKLLQPLACCKKRAEKKLHRYDQWGNPTSHEIVVNGHRFNAEANELEPLFIVNTKKVVSDDQSTTDKFYDSENIPDDLALTENNNENESHHKANSLFAGIF